MRIALPRSCLAALLLAASLVPAAAQGHGFGDPRPSHGGGSGGRGGHGAAVRARAAVYEVITVSAVTDAAALRAALAKLGPSLAGTGGRLLVDADDPAPIAGAGPAQPAHMAVAVFDDASDAGRWTASPAFKALAAEVGRAGALQVSAAGGIADPGAPPAVPAAALGPARGLDRLPSVPKIADICKGC